MKRESQVVHNRQGWRMPEDTVKVDRSTKFGNPFTEEEMRAGRKHFPPELITDLCVRSFHGWLLGAGARFPQQRETLIAALPGLRGKNLACWCALDAQCHADVLLELANR